MNYKEQLKDKLFISFLEIMQPEEVYQLYKEIIETKLRIRSSETKYIHELNMVSYTSKMILFKLNPTQDQILKSLCFNNESDLKVYGRAVGVTSVLNAFLAVNILIGKFKGVRLVGNCCNYSLSQIREFCEMLEIDSDEMLLATKKLFGKGTADYVIVDNCTQLSDNDNKYLACLPDAAIKLFGNLNFKL